MIVKVRRVTLSEYTQIVEKMGPKAKFFEVPSTKDGVKFKGCYTSTKGDEIAVSWPTDRPHYAQQEYSQKHTCGFPVEEFETREFMNGGVH